MVAITAMKKYQKLAFMSCLYLYYTTGPESASLSY